MLYIFFFSWKALCLKISDFFCIYRKFLQYDNQLLCGFIALGTTICINIKSDKEKVNS